jgi:endonuclease-3
MKERNKKNRILSERLRQTVELLERHQGEKVRDGSPDPVDVLMLTLLSQNTNDALRDRAFARLRRRFPRWSDVQAAPTEQIEEAIRTAGLSRQKAVRMKEILGWMQAEFGDISLKPVEKLETDRALELLKSRKGVGIKTAAVVLMIAWGRDLCPVDTHVHRISRRLGWVPETATAEKTFELLKPHVPVGKGYSLHMNLLQFGRTVCLARKPLCGDCFLYDECEWEGKLQRRVQRGETPSR